MKFYVTYGFNTLQRSNFSVVHGVDYDDARRKVFSVAGNQFAFMYDEAEWQAKDRPRPQPWTQADEYRLTEIPLQAQQPFAQDN